MPSTYTFALTAAPNLRRDRLAAVSHPTTEVVEGMCFEPTRAVHRSLRVRPRDHPRPGTGRVGALLRTRRPRARGRADLHRRRLRGVGRLPAGGGAAGPPRHDRAPRRVRGADADARRRLL